MKRVFWLREETKANEFRRALAPIDCQKLIQNGHSVIVEDWKDSIIPIEEYEKVGCQVEPAGSWANAPKECLIVGLKALPKNLPTLHHTHIFFAHAFKAQDGWKELLTKFKNDGGKVVDLEYMVNDQGRRIAAFGHWAGYVGAALGALLQNNRDLESSLKELNEHKYFNRKERLIEFIQNYQKKESGKAIVIGSRGRSGQGATSALTTLGYSVTQWDMEETAKGGPFKEILDHDLFVNCVLALQKMPPFINYDLLKQNTHLQVISDVSCDPDSDCNMVPLYNVATTLENLFHTIKSASGDVKLTAIDNLPSILPFESSLDFSSQLVDHLIDFDEQSGAVRNALTSYYKALERL